MGWVLGLGNGVVFRTGSSQSWSSYWSHLISATVEQAEPTNVVLTFPTAKPSLGASDFTIAGFTISSASWTGAVLTLVLSTAVNYGDSVVVTFVPSGGTATATNNVTHPLVIEDGHTVAWYKADDLTTITKDGSDFVSVWADKLGSGRNLLQATGGLQPIWTEDGISFTLHRMQTAAALFTGANARSIYVVYRNRATGSFTGAICGQSTGTTASTWFMIQARTLTVTGDPYLACFADDLGNGLTVPDTVRKYALATYDGTTAKIYKDGNLIGEDDKTLNTVNNGFRAGYDGVTSADAEINEIIVRDVVDTGTDKTVLDTYMNNRKLFFLNDVDKILVLGNSMTIHPIVSYWWGEWGMAASIRENDYIHKLQTKIRQTNSNCVVTPCQAGDWERNHTTYDKSSFDLYFITSPDIVIIRLGENVSDETDFDTSLQALIDYIKLKAPLAEIMITGTFWNGVSVSAILAASAAANGFKYTELNSLNIAENRSSIGATVYDEDGDPHLIDNEGVAQHPNDAGMSLIADKIYGILS